MKFLILGGNGGVGSIVASSLRAADHQVTIAGRNAAEITALANQLNCPHLIVDAADIVGIEECVKSAKSTMGGLNGIVNCVGSVLIKAAHATSDEEWFDTLNRNLTSAFGVVKAAATTLREEGGSVVLFSSAAAEIGLPNHEAIAAAKAGVVGLARSAAATYASKNIRFNVISPGLVKSKMTKSIWSNERSASYSQQLHALGRLGEPRDIASLVLWLLDKQNDWITGSVFNVDGGLSRVRATSRA